jgi:GGDEF domain-containing protein
MSGVGLTAPGGPRNLSLSSLRLPRRQVRGLEATMRHASDAHSRTPSTEPMTKRSLIAVSHAIEQAVAVRAASPDEPVILVAMFQRPLYFDRERAAYRELSKAATLTVVGVVDQQPDVPPGVEGVALSSAEPLAAEWSVVMLTPRAGAALVAIDREELFPAETSVEQGRLFDGWWSFRRSDAQEQLHRLAAALGDRLSRRAQTIIDDVLEEAGSRRSSAVEDRAGAATRLIVHRLEQANRQIRQMEGSLRDLAPHPHRDVLTGLATKRWLTGWAGAAAGSASGTLPLTLLMLDLPGLTDVIHWSGNDVGNDLVRRVAEVIGRPLREVDHAVRLEQGRFLVVLPGLTQEQGQAMADRMRSEIAEVVPRGARREGDVEARTAVLVTRDRPLPLDALAERLTGGLPDRAPNPPPEALRDTSPNPPPNPLPDILPDIPSEIPEQAMLPEQQAARRPNGNGPVIDLRPFSLDRAEPGRGAG